MGDGLFLFDDLGGDRAGGGLVDGDDRAGDEVEMGDVSAPLDAFEAGAFYDAVEGDRDFCDGEFSHAGRVKG